MYLYCTIISIFMKIKLLLLCLLLGWGVATNAEAQRPAGDIIYLRDGSILKGTIVQMSPNRPVQVVTSDGRTFILKRSDILRFTHGELAMHDVRQQRHESPGYLGFKLGPTYSPEYETLGASVSLDFGYRWTNIGIASRSSISLFDKDKHGVEMKALAMRINLGPLFSFRTSARGYVDITPMAGISRVYYFQKQQEWQKMATPVQFGWEIGTQYRHRIGRRTDLMAGFNYSYTMGHDEIGFGLGVAFKLD